MTEERDQRVVSENREKDQNKRMQRQIRDIKEEMTELSKKETEASRKKHELVRMPLYRYSDYNEENLPQCQTIKWFL